MFIISISSSMISITYICIYTIINIGRELWTSQGAWLQLSRISAPRSPQWTSSAASAPGVMSVIPTVIWVALLVQRDLSKTASFVLCGFRRVKDHHYVLHCSPMLKKTCVRHVVLAEQLPLKYVRHPYQPYHDLRYIHTYTYMYAYIHIYM